MIELKPRSYLVGSRESSTNIEIGGNKKMAIVRTGKPGQLRILSLSFDTTESRLNTTVLLGIQIPAAIWASDEFLYLVDTTQEGTRDRMLASQFYITALLRRAAIVQASLKRLTLPI